MIRARISSVIVFIAATSATTGTGQSAKFVPQIAPSAGRDMIYGACLASSLGLGKDGPYINRAFSIALADRVTVSYDLDRYSPAVFWQGGFLDGSGTHLTSYKGQGPTTPKGKVLFKSLGHNGWAASSPDNMAKRGLPIPWIDYEGHYTFGDRVVLGYKVHGRLVWECPSSTTTAHRTRESQCGLVRDFRIAPGSRELRLILGTASPEGIPNSKTDRVKNDTGDLFVSSSPKSDKLNWHVSDEKSLQLVIPPSSKPLQFRLVTIPSSVSPEVVDLLLDSPPLGGEMIDLTKGGPSRWPQRLVTKGKLANDDSAYVSDKITVPHDNPWKSWMQLTALDFFSDGRLAVCTLNGDVWIVSEIDKTLDNVQWKRFAGGLYEPLGLKIVGDQIYVTGRDRITRLHDLNDDDEADFYESFYAGGTPGYGYHAFAFELHTDSKGNFYFVKGGRKAWGGGDDYNFLIRVSPDGRTAEKVAGGFRHPNGMSIGPNDEILVADNEGDSIISSRVNLIRPGGFYGYASDNYRKKNVDPPLYWMPKKVDSSTAGQLFVTDRRWGPLNGSIVHLSYSKLLLFYATMQKVGDHGNAAAVQFPFRFTSGLMRARINPQDGQVYVCGLKGWDTAAVEEGCLNRIRYTGKPAYLMRSFKASKDGIRLGFTCQLDKAAADPDNYNIEQWNYKSKNPTPQEVFIENVQVAANRRSVLIQVEKLAPVDQMEIGMTLRAADGAEIRQTVYATINRLPANE
ncbi:MAG: DUF6797 domain-containing protein [Pirellulales bacterium]